MTVDPTLTTLQAVMFATITIALYAAFLAVQTSRHRDYFLQRPSSDSGADDPHQPAHHAVHSVAYLPVFLVLTMLLSKKLAPLVDFGIGTLVAPAVPTALGGIIVAVLVVSPEGMAAIYAALAN